MKHLFSLVLLLPFSFTASAQKEMKIEKGSFCIPVENMVVYGEPLTKAVGIHLEKNDVSLKKIASVDILTPELSEVKSVNATFSEFGSEGIIHVTVINKNFGSDVLQLWLNKDLKELQRSYQNSEDAKKNAETKGIQKDMLPHRHNVMSALEDLNDLYTPDGQLYLYYDNGVGPGLGNVGKFTDDGAKTTLLRYSMNGKKHSLAWQCDLSALQNISSYKMIVSGNLVFLETISEITTDSDAGQMNIICIDYTTGSMIWNTLVPMTEGLCPEAPVLSYNEKTSVLTFAGMESAPYQWKKTMKAGKPACQIYLGTIDKSSEVKVTHTNMPEFETDSFPGYNMSNKLDRPYWEPSMVVTRADGSHLACGMLGFVNYHPQQDIAMAGPSYLGGTRWVGGSMFATFGDGGASAKITCNYFENYGSYMNNVSEFTPCYWDEANNKMCMALVNSNEAAIPATDRFTVAYYMLEVTGNDSKIEFITTADDQDLEFSATSQGIPLSTPYVLAFNSRELLYIPYSDKKPSAAISAKIKH
jgi:hypothetical protein